MKNRIYLFKEGKNGRHISRDLFGKIIIGENCSEPGFYILKELKELKNCYIAKIDKKVNFDYYPGMSYDEFKKFILHRGYKLAFEMPFKYEGLDEMRLVVYSEKYNMIVVADTIKGKKKFNDIYCYCYGVNGLQSLRDRYFSKGSRYSTVYNIVNGGNEGALHCVEHYSFTCWKPTIRLSDIPSGFTYADNLIDEKDYSFYKNIFLDSCPPELKMWFTDNSKEGDYYE